MRALIFAAALFAFASQAEAVNRYVCSGAGATGNNDCGVGAGGDPDYTTIQAAVTAAGSGDTIFIVPAVYNETVTLPNKGNLASPIVIRSSVADSNFPATGVRLCPNTRIDGNPLWCSPNVNVSNLPTIVGTNSSNNSRSFIAATGAQDYVLRFLRVISNSTTRGQNDMIQIGINDTTQQLPTDQPRDFVIDRILAEGDPIIGQRAGVSINGENISVINSYIVGIGGLGQDSQAISGVNGNCNPCLIENNHLEASGENFLTGGADPQLRTFVNTAAGSTTTTINVDLATIRPTHTLATLSVGQRVAVQINSTTREHTIVATKVDADTFTVSPALSSAPAAGLDVRWGAQYKNVTFRRNFVHKPSRWKTAILPTTSSVSVSADEGTGSLAAGTYYYLVEARTTGYQGSTVRSPNSQQVSCALTATGSCVLTWTAVTGASEYRVWGRSNGGQNMWWTVTAPTVTFTDTGSAGSTGTGSASLPPGSNGSRWQVKVLFEIKQCDDCIVEDNIFDNSWSGTGGTRDGMGVWIKSVNQDGNSAWVSTDNVIFRRNVIRHVTGCFLFTSQEEYEAGTLQRPAPLDDLLVEDTLCYDSGSQYGGNNAAVHTGYTQHQDLTFRRNTILHSSSATWIADQPALGTTTVSDNIFLHNTYGFKFGSLSSGNPSLDAFWLSKVFLNNVITNTSAAYPATTIESPLADIQGAFVNYGGPSIGDYDLLPAHAFRTGSSTGARIGADIPTLVTSLAGVEAGTASGAPTWTTISPLPSGTSGVAYTTQVAATGGTGGKTYSLIGSLPPGLSLAGATGVISGTPTGGASSYNFTLRATDQAAASSDRAFAIQINAAGGTLTITTTSVADVDANTPYSALLNATGGTPPYAWTITGGSIPPGLTLSQTTGVISGTPTAAGNYNFTVRVDGGASFDTQDLTIRVSNVGPSGPNPVIPRPNVWNGQSIWTFSSDTPPTVDENRVRPKDIWVGPNNVPYVITATSPTVTATGIGAHLILSYSVTGVGTTMFEHTLVDTPVGGKEWGEAGMRYPVDLTRGYSEFRVFGYVNNATAIATAVMRAEYSLDCSTGWTQLAATAGTGTLPTTSVSTTTVRSAFVTIADAAKADVCIRLWHTTGDGADDIAFRLLGVEIR